MTVELYQGDCLKIMNHFEDKSIDFVLADPPFGTTNCSWDILIPLDPMWYQLKRITKDNAAIVLFAQAPFDKVLACSNLEMFKYEWIWEKPNGTGFLNSKKMPIKVHENILVFYNKLPIYNPQKTTGHERKTAGKKPVLSEHYGKSTKKSFYNSTERYPRSVQRYSSEKQIYRNMHPSLKPLMLIEYLIKTYTNEGFIVLDFCMGSGTTGVGCKKLNRLFIGIEKYLKHFDIAKKRINDTKYHQLTF